MLTAKWQLACTGSWAGSVPAAAKALAGCSFIPISSIACTAGLWTISWPRTQNQDVLRYVPPHGSKTVANFSLFLFGSLAGYSQNELQTERYLDFLKIQPNLLPPQSYDHPLSLWAPKRGRNSSLFVCMGHPFHTFLCSCHGIQRMGSNYLLGSQVGEDLAWRWPVPYCLFSVILLHL